MAANAGMLPDMFSSFPTLKIVGSDILGSWKYFREEFSLALRAAKLNFGVDQFGDQHTVVALLRSVGEEARKLMVIKGFSIDRGNLIDAWRILTEHYGCEENIFVKTEKFYSAQQKEGEDDRDYLVRVESLSRDVKLEHSDRARQQLALIIAINGLRDSTTRCELMANRICTGMSCVGLLSPEVLPAKQARFCQVMCELLLKGK